VLRQALPDTPAGFAELCDHLRDACATTPALSGDQPGVALDKVLDALRRLRSEPSLSRVIERAPRELCGTGLFDRVMFSLVRGSTWRPQALYRYGPTGEVTRELDHLIDDLEVPLASPLLEAEVVRRRLPALVADAQAEPRLYRPLIERTGTPGYIVAPVVAESSVMGLIHADTLGRSLSSIDRDLLRIFADGVGLICECAGLAGRIERQRAKVAEVCEAVVRSLQEPDTRPSVRTAGAKSRSAIAMTRPAAGEPRMSSRLARLTAREREVLALLASGATNSQLADRLTVAESTVKSHVKHILHKLGAGNRAAAIACYLRETHNDERSPR